MKNISLIGFLIFLCVYSYLKYTAVPSLMGTTLYMISTAVLVILTAILPYFLTRVFSAKVRQDSKYVVLALVPVTLSVIGLAIYFYVFIAPNNPSLSVLAVLPRAIMPGVAISVLLLLPALVQNKKAALAVEN